jgi:hypothetical protein
MQEEKAIQAAPPTHTSPFSFRSHIFASPRYCVDISPFLRVYFTRLTGNLEDGLGQALDVAGGDTSDGDTAVLGGVDGVL